MNLREAAEQALEALEEYSPIPTDGPWHKRHHKAITTLRAALADATCQESRQVEPVAYVTGYSKGYATVQPVDPCLLMCVGMALYRSPPTISKTETVEPVAWIGCLEGGIEYGTYHKAALKLPDGVRFDLYTAPPKRKPLTPEEIQECVAEVDDARLAGPITALIRAVERKLGIGGEE